MRALLLFLLLVSRGVHAQALALPPPPQAQFAPLPGTRLPLDARLVDDSGAPIRLGALFGRSPVVLVPGYYTCPNLCSTLFEGVLQALALSGLPPDAYALAGLSIDPRDTPARAAEKKRAYAGLLPDGARLRLLTGNAASIAAVSAAIGYRAERDPATGQFAHAAGFVVASPDGRVARYFPGVRFEPAALRAALQAAQEGRPQGIGERLLLLCAHYDPRVGTNSAAAMAFVRAGALLVMLALAAWAWRRLRRDAP